MSAIVLENDVAHANPIDGEQQAVRALVDERKREVATDPVEKFVAALQPGRGDGLAEDVKRSGTAGPVTPRGMTLNRDVDGPCRVDCGGSRGTDGREAKLRTDVRSHAPPGDATRSARCIASMTSVALPPASPYHPHMPLIARSDDGQSVASSHSLVLTTRRGRSLSRRRRAAGFSDSSQAASARPFSDGAYAVIARTGSVASAQRYLYAFSPGPIR